jgi:hypothetical protein
VGGDVDVAGDPVTAAVPVEPGVILAVWSSNSFFGTVIRLGAVLRGRPGVANHVIVVTHQDQAGRWMGIEGRPGGVGPVDCTPFLADSRTRGNHAQPRPNDAGQLEVFLASCAASLGIDYDWVGIGQDTARSIGLHNLAKAIDPLWRWGGNDKELPGHVVCSSLAAMLYKLTGWASPEPGAERQTTPAQWWDWADRQLWKAAS